MASGEKLGIAEFLNFGIGGGDNLFEIYTFYSFLEFWYENVIFATWSTELDLPV